MVNELKNSWVDSWVSKLVKLVSWWYRPDGQFADDRMAVAVWKGFAKEMRPRSMA